MYPKEKRTFLPAMEIQLPTVSGKATNQDRKSGFRVVILQMKVETYNLSLTAFHI